MNRTMERSPSFVVSEFSIAEETKEDLGAEEDDMGLANNKVSRKVCIYKSIFVAVLVAVAVGVIILVNLTTSREEQDRFETEFEDLASKLTDNFLTIFETKVWTGQTIATTYSSDSKYYNLSWPNVLLPNFDLRMLGHRKVAKSDTIMFAPLVTNVTRDSWEAYVVANADQVPLKPDDAPGCENQGDCRTLADGIYSFDGVSRAPDPGPGPYFPYFQVATSNRSVAIHVLSNYYTLPTLKPIYDLLLESKTAVISEPRDGDPLSILFSPVFDTVESLEVVGCVQLDVDWLSFFQKTVTPTEGSVTAVVHSETGGVMSFDISEDEVVYLGDADYHDPRYDGYSECSEVVALEGLGPTYSATTVMMVTLGEGESKTFSYGLCVYPTEFFEDAYLTRLPASYTAVTACVFLFVLIMFFIYEKFVEQRQRRVQGQRDRFGRVVNQLFPPTFRNRILGKEETLTTAERPTVQKRWSSFKRRMSHDGSTARVVEPAKARLRTFLSDNEKRDFAEMEEYKYDEPIADLFPETTIMFADISGFTAWSSEREPSQVFYLLETLYRSFDQLASRLGVFKVETIGDCYVAVTGLPDPNKDHAVVMARFAYECILEMSELVKSLEVSLGPGTSDLAIRVGLHSGPVTAGVLRGEKARFQLFGDTMNTASRMESTGERYRIHVSQDTARKLKKGGKGHWVVERDGIVIVKGKGEMKTWWVQPRRAPEVTEFMNNDHSAIEQIPPPPESKPSRTPPSNRRSSKTTDNWGNLTLDIYEVDADKKARLVNWNVEVLGELLSKVVVWRSIRAQSQPTRRRRSDNNINVDALFLDSLDDSDEDQQKYGVLSEVSEIIHLPSYTENSTLLGALTTDSSVLSSPVKAQLKHFISRIADYYHNVPFHNLEHASHVTLSANKLMKRIISPDSIDTSLNPDKIDQEDLHNSSFGISSDPLTQFTIIFSALIHDVEHTGVPNAVLVAENDDLAMKYDNKSVAENHSVHIALSLLSAPRFQALQAAIHSTITERGLFRQILVNTVLATDIMDESIKSRRQERWSKAFDEEENACSTLATPNTLFGHRRATVVIEHIIQASDVAHTMQHWHVFRRWNEKLFMENYQSFKSNRCKGFTSMDWYMQEITFFDDYIIPLAHKLKESGVFGVSSDEYLNYALANRDEWISKGNDIAQQLVAKAEAKFAADRNKNKTFVSRVGRAA
mmetsp:Transcript_23869/g.39456  ORF Transcript_23869/g.39456 Transcript_23869/m.39456 type:complete len:1195 (-) Transcript_23869:99-3683(-)